MTHLKLHKITQKGDIPSANRLHVNVLLSNIIFLSRVSILTRDIDIANSVCLSVRP